VISGTPSSDVESGGGTANRPLGGDAILKTQNREACLRVFKKKKHFGQGLTGNKSDPVVSPKDERANVGEKGKPSKHLNLL